MKSANHLSAEEITGKILNARKKLPVIDPGSLIKPQEFATVYARNSSEDWIELPNGQVLTVLRTKYYRANDELVIEVLSVSGEHLEFNYHRSALSNYFIILRSS